MADRIAVVTGASAGIGEALTTVLLAAGWRVAGVARREVTRTETRYAHFQADLADLDSLSRLEAALAEFLQDGGWGRLGLVNNAAIQGQMRAIERLEPERILSSLALNVVAPMALMGLCHRLCPPAKPLRIVNLTSLAATTALPGVSDYMAGKAGLRLAGMGVGAEAEASDRDIAILSYDPGTVDTAMHERARAESPEDFPSSATFHYFREAGMLVPARRVTGPIVEFLEGSSAPGFHESQYDPTSGDTNEG